MKKLLFLVLLSCFLGACADSLKRSLPSSEQEGLRIDLGGFELPSNLASYTPYFTKSNIVFINEEGQEVSFFMTQPAHTGQFLVEEEYPDPNGEYQSVRYIYTAERYEFEFLSPPFGAKLEVELINSLCGDPMLDDESSVNPHLKITALGFNNPNAQEPFPNPIMDVQIDEKIFCKDGANTQFYPEFPIGNKVYQEVFYSRVLYGNTTIEVYYNFEFGILYYKDRNHTWVLDRIL